MKTLVQIAEAEVGNRESGGNNRGKSVVKYQKATNLDPDNWPWCAAFVDWCIQQLLLQPEYQNMAPKQRPTTAAAFGLLEWAKKQGLTTPTPDDYHPKAGDIVVYEFSHCGIVTGYSPGTITTVEGNTNGKGERDSVTGDGVWRKTRSTSLVRRYIKMP